MKSIVSMTNAFGCAFALPFPHLYTTILIAINIINIRFYIGLIRNIQLYQCLKQLQNIYFVCSLIQSITPFLNIFIHIRQTVTCLISIFFVLFCFVCFVCYCFLRLFLNSKMYMYGLMYIQVSKIY